MEWKQTITVFSSGYFHHISWNELFLVREAGCWNSKTQSRSPLLLVCVFQWHPRRAGPHYSALTWTSTIFCPKLAFLIREANDRRQSQRSEGCRSPDSLSVPYLLQQASALKYSFMWCTKCTIPGARAGPDWLSLMFTQHPTAHSELFQHFSPFLATQLTLFLFNPFQNSQRSCILLEVQEAHSWEMQLWWCCRDAQRAGQGQVANFPELSSSSAHEKSGFWIITHWWFN